MTTNHIDIPSEVFEVAESDEGISPHRTEPPSTKTDKPESDGSVAWAPHAPPSALKNSNVQTRTEPFGESADEGNKDIRQSSRVSSAARNVSFIDMEVFEEESEADDVHDDPQPTDTMEVLESFEAPIRSKTILRLPEKLRNLGANIQMLSADEILHISDIVSRRADKETNSVSKYSNRLWYVPEISNAPPDGAQFDIGFSFTSGLRLTVFGKTIRLRVLSYALRAALLGLLWIIVWTSTIPNDWSYVRGYILDPSLTFLVSTAIGGTISRFLGIPSLIGIMWCAVIWTNIPEYQYFTHGVLPQVRTIALRSSLVVILVRTGAFLNIRTFLPLLKNVVVASSAVFVEAIMHAIMAQYYLNYNDWIWSLCQGMVCACPTTAVVLPGVMMLQAEGYGKTKGPLQLMIGTLVVEYAVALWVGLFLMGLLTSDWSEGFQAAMVPVQIIGGFIIGLASGWLIHFCVWLVRNEAQRLPTGKYSFAHQRTVRKTAIVSTLVLSHALTFLAWDINMLGTAAIAVITLGAFLSNYWVYGDDPEWVEIKIGLTSGLVQFWESFALPALFSMSATNVSFGRVFDTNVFPKGLLIMFVSCTSKALFVGISPFGLDLTWKERLFFMVSSLSKATVQVAQASVPLATFSKKLLVIDPTADPEGYAATIVLRDRAIMFQSIVMLFALIPAPLVVIWVKKFGPVALRKE